MYTHKECIYMYNLPFSGSVETSILTTSRDPDIVIDTALRCSISVSNILAITNKVLRFWGC